MSKDDITVSLFKSKHCGHCVAFSEEWGRFQQKCSEYGINANTYDADEPKHRQVFEDEGIQGYPTIKIKYGNNTYDYNEARTAEGILNFINKLKNKDKPNLRGGGNGDVYAKYRKYKSKYLKLRYKTNV